MERQQLFERLNHMKSLVAVFAALLVAGCAAHPSPVPHSSFGGAIDVRFDVSDAQVQDAVAARCGLRDAEKRDPFEVLYKLQSDDSRAVLDCVRRQPHVNGAGLPL